MESVIAQTARTLLLVDDDPSIHELVQAMLRDSRWEIDCDGNGDEALQRLQSRAFNLILTDILMPGMDGLTLLSNLRNHYPDTRVVVMTLKNKPEHILGSLTRDATGYVSKPFSRDGLMATLENALSASLAPHDIKVLSDRPHWISLQISCQLATAEHLTEFVRELPSDLDPDDREHIATALQELLMNAIEHGGHLDPRKALDLSYIRTARSIVYYVRDPGEGFLLDELDHAATANTTDEPFRHVEVREKMGIRPGGFGLLVTKNFADEVMYRAKGNEVILIKYL